MLSTTNMIDIFKSNIFSYIFSRLGVLHQNYFTPQTKRI